MASLDLDSLDLLGAGAPDGRPLSIPLDRIDEDPHQPRHEFDAGALRQLADTIARVGVRQPVSVRFHRTQPGRYVLNFGARRLRASRLAGKAVIPAFVDEVLDTYDQVIENEQREPLSAMELAIFVERQLKAGQSRLQIATGMGKSPQYVTYAAALIDAPDWLMELYRAGRCRGMLELHELRRLHGLDPASVVAWLSGVRSIGRPELQRLKSAIAASRSPTESQPSGELGQRGARSGGGKTSAARADLASGARTADARRISPDAARGGRDAFDAKEMQARVEALLAALRLLVGEMKHGGEPGTVALQALSSQLTQVLSARSP